MSNDVTSIGHNAFHACSSLTYVDMSDGVTSIGDKTFSGCSSLISIDIPASVTLINDATFSGCSTLKSVYITDLSAWCKITFEDYDLNPLYKGGKLYLNNNELTDLVIPTDIKRIKDYAFYGYKSLQKVTMGTDITSIGIHSFRDCSSLTQVYCQGTIPPTINVFHQLVLQWLQ